MGAVFEKLRTLVTVSLSLILLEIEGEQCDWPVLCLPRYFYDYVARNSLEFILDSDRTQCDPEVSRN